MLKKLTLVLAIVLAVMLSLSSCTAKEPEPTPSPPPTATTVIVPPTSTPMPPPPTATDTPIPIPTVTDTPLPPTPTDTASSPTAKVTADLLNLRSKPTIESDILDKVLVGTTLPALGRSQDSEWVLVSLSDGTQGWVSAEWVELSMPIDALPMGEVLPPTPTPTPTPTPVPPTETATPESTPGATPTLMPAPVLLEPASEQTFGARGPGQLTWRWDSRLASDQFFVVTITYPHEGSPWRDIHWVKETFFVPPAYLRDLITNDRRCEWRVVVMRQTGTASDGMKTGEPVSQQSGVRIFVWGD